VHLLEVSLALREMSLPVSTSPVRETMPTSGCLTRRSPAGTPSPVTTLKTPGGKIPSASSASRSAVSGVHSDGLSTIAFPAASAGPNFQTAM